MRSEVARLAQIRIQPVNIGLNFHWASLIYNLATHDGSRICTAISRRKQLTFDAVRTLSYHDLYGTGPFAQYHYFQCLATFRTYGDLFGIHFCSV